MLAQKSEFLLRSDLNRCLRTIRPSKRFVGAARLVISRIDQRSAYEPVLVAPQRNGLVILHETEEDRDA